MITLKELLTDDEQRAIMFSRHRLILIKSFLNLTVNELYVVAAIRKQKLHKAVKELNNDFNEIASFNGTAYANQ